MMTVSDDDSNDEQFARLLAELDDSLETGNPVEVRETVEDPELKARLHEARTCLELLHSAWPKAGKPSARPSVTAPLDADSPQLIGRFAIERELGRGGHGVVFLAFDPLLKRHVAIKVPRPENLVSESMRERFQREAQLAARLNHPNLVAIYEVGATGPLTYLVTAYCPGPSLAKWLKSQTIPLPHRQAAELLLPLVDAVAFMHDHGVLHRDIKPGNILLDTSAASDQDGKWNEARSKNSGVATPKLTDFGLATLADPATRHTLTGSLVGTLAYMPPEQVDMRRNAIGPQMDIYSLGVVLYECLTGKLPFQGLSEADLIRQLLSDEPISPRRVRPEIPRDLEIICLKCLEKDPRNRYASAAILADDLRSFLRDEPIRARPATRLESLLKWGRRHPAVATMSVVTTMASLCLVGLTIWHIAALQKHGEELNSTLTERNAALARAASVERQLVAENYAVQIKFAESMQDGDAVGNLSGMLDRLRPQTGHEDQRGFEWYYLKNVGNRLRTLRGHRRAVHELSISPDGRRLASGSSDGMVHVWDIATGLTGPGISLAERNDPNFTDKECNLTFDHEGKHLFISISDHKGKCSLAVWDADLRREVARHIGEKYEDIWSVFASPVDDIVGFLNKRINGSTCVSVWNWKNGGQTDLPLLAETIVCKYRKASFSPDGQMIVAHSLFHPEILVWDMPSGSARASMTEHDSGIYGSSWSSDGKQLAIGFSDERLGVWDIPGNAFKYFDFKVGIPIRKVAFQPNGQLIAMTPMPRNDLPLTNTLSLYDATSGERLPLELKSDCTIHDMAWTPDGKTIAMAFHNHHVRLWSPYTKAATSTLNVTGTKEAWALAFSPDSKTLAVGYDDEAGMDRETLKLWDIESQNEIRNWDTNRCMVTGVAFSPDGNTVYSAGYDRKLKSWNCEADQFIKGLGQHEEVIMSLAISSDGQTIATAGKDKVVTLWDAETGQTKFVLTGHTGLLHSVTLDPTGNLVASSDHTSQLRIWSVQTGTMTQLIHDTAEVRAVAFSPDGAQLATANLDGIVSLYEAATGAELIRLNAHRGHATAVTFAPDGKTLATGGADGTVRLWHVKTHREMLVFKNLSASVNRLAFSPNGQHLAVALMDGSVRLWHATPK